MYTEINEIKTYLINANGHITPVFVRFVNDRYGAYFDVSQNIPVRKKTGAEETAELQRVVVFKVHLIKYDTTCKNLLTTVDNVSPAFSVTRNYKRIMSKKKQSSMMSSLWDYDIFHNHYTCEYNNFDTYEEMSTLILDELMTTIYHVDIMQDVSAFMKEIKPLILNCVNGINIITNEGFEARTIDFRNYVKEISFERNVFNLGNVRIRAENFEKLGDEYFYKENDGSKTSLDLFLLKCIGHYNYRDTAGNTYTTAALAKLINDSITQLVW